MRTTRPDTEARTYFVLAYLDPAERGAAAELGFEDRDGELAMLAIANSAMS